MLPLSKVRTTNVIVSVCTIFIRCTRGNCRDGIPTHVSIGEWIGLVDVTIFVINIRVRSLLYHRGIVVVLSLVCTETISTIRNARIHVSFFRKITILFLYRILYYDGQ